MTIANLIDGAIPLALGVYLLLIATNKMTYLGNLKMQNWAQEKKKLFLFIGPFLIIFGILSMLGIFSR